MLLAYHRALLEGLREATREDPLRILVSGCLAGWACGVDASDYGLGPVVADLLASPLVRALPFCPEQHGLGTPRSLPDLHGGDGLDLLAGRARALAPDGTDLTEGMLAGARAMTDFALRQRVELGLLTDMSAACGSQVISSGCRLDTPRRFQKGVGVATAMLLEAKVPVVSQRDHHTLGLLRAKLVPGFTRDERALDHHEHPWTRAHLPAPHRRALRIDRDD